MRFYTLKIVRMNFVEIVENVAFILEKQQLSWISKTRLPFAGL